MKNLIALALLLICIAAKAKEGMLAGNLNSVGSDTLGNLMALWGDHFSQQYPGVNVQIQASGSSTAPTALAAGAAQLGAMSRPMQAAERQLFADRYGYPPLAVPVAIDALVVVVNQDNPLAGLNARQLDAIFSVTRLCGGALSPHSWGDLQLTQPGWAQRGIQRFGRNSASGTWGFFKQQALCNGDLRRDVGEYPGSAAVVQAVAGSLNGIGYASAGFHLSGVKVLPLARDENNWISPTAENIRSGRYPYARPLYIYVNKAPDKPLEPLTAAFLRLALSGAGQALVSQAGYLPLSEAQREQALAMMAQ
ncbi:PstS family phosphate ABC transporter substrate-binding protein [Erwinia amylovora]|uniref:Phosphate-binding protein n=5 Tax=Erwiniaceae TaxID=1903409 RepID=A0A830ZR85_ERWAM|nr:PstS family phosphate ABC transporter substrate-binding protein [Erwinia amylovora]CBX79788.1 putative phosphate binding protein [Erwinia amylovora ATCC BAA-2158]CDK14506.1 putative phosphate binding protein [Erwinia amylovora LA635]CDK17873.1 putative phosphate binding protein [Erwinia amylovora LA636]CDK21242.1 putative phosphate binding protein [Erwinia amylovora LA637]ATZ10842.1 phosphate ABC transporter substrate-binding protein [Erwinia amylovora]